MKALLFVLISLSAFAQDPMPYKKKGSGFMPVCDNTKLELKNLPPLRDQGRFGLCYAHSSLLLLEHLRCSNNPNPSECYNNKGSVLHLSRYHNTATEERIRMGGDPRSVLTRFNQDKKLATEVCSEYEDWKKLDALYKDERKKLMMPDSERDENDFFYYISRRMKQNTATEGDLTCWANDLMKAGVNQNLQDIMAILSRGKEVNWQELRYQLLVPKSCLKSMIQYPDYTTHIYPTYKDQKSFKGYRDFVFRALSQGHPVEASFKSSANGYHSATITGQRHVCDGAKCEYQFRIQNSYGKSWQDNNDDGWVNAEHLTSLMNDPSMGLTVILPKDKAPNTTLVAPYYEKSATSKGTYSAAEKCWKIPAKAQQYADDSNRSAPTRPSTPAPKGEKGVWKCTKGGKTIFGEYQIDGAECKKIQ